MDWQGIEWALPVYELVMLGMPIYAFITLRRRVKRGILTKVRAFWYYAGLVVAPVISYILFFLGLVGIWEVAHISLITEGLGRSFFLVTGLGAIIWLVSSMIFGVAMVFTKSTSASPNPPLNRTHEDNTRAG